MVVHVYINKYKEILLFYFKPTPKKKGKIREIKKEKRKSTTPPPI
jgi:hypothetical protein